MTSSKPGATLYGRQKAPQAWGFSTHAAQRGHPALDAFDAKAEKREEARA
jgi:hypothetical protein